METKDILNLLEKSLEMDSGSLSGDETLDGLADWDSLSAVIFIGEVDEAFGITIEPEQLDDAVSVKDLVTLIQSSIQ